jgi:hypothetical protein
MSNPIPRRLLRDTATYTPYTGTVHDVKTYGAAVALTFVRFEAVKQNAMTSLGDMKNDKINLFYDSKNSLPIGITFKANDIITSAGINYTVRKANPLKGTGSAIHHWEVACV